MNLLEYYNNNIYLFQVGRSFSRLVESPDAHHCVTPTAGRTLPSKVCDAVFAYFFQQRLIERGGGAMAECQPFLQGT